MTEKTFTLEINGYEYEMPYWTFPWIRTAVGDLKEGGVPLNLRAPNSVDLWIKADYQVEFFFDDPRDPEIPESLTDRERHLYMDIFDGDRAYGHRVLDVSHDDGDPLLWEWDDPKYRERP
ncbi:MAG: hypothetical protein DI573_14150 [Microbacterium sp.]|uniref:hypothetical protein n=1 Tax=Microbacterium sp. TaxID=51671 RepID=UPI000DB00D61|nr:hypothetical protein [Microbacterium sp.]PZU36203.1 MAG: hypothetical protein DI573_14150 [Microbacterium sp.]